MDYLPPPELKCPHATRVFVLFIHRCILSTQKRLDTQYMVNRHLLKELIPSLSYMLTCPSTSVHQPCEDTVGLIVPCITCRYYVWCQVEGR